jgi:thymidylate synthase
LSSKARDANYGFAVGEFLWYWQGRQDLEMMLYYNKRMKDFSDDGKTLNSDYGWRMKKDYNYDRPMTQWDVVKKTLIDDPDSRRALIIINGPHDQCEAAVFGSKDVPCTLSLQFFIRDNKLVLHSHMRSNDAVWGLTYDLFSFTLFQECMLLELKKFKQLKDLELGNYYHTAGSMHVYERHFDMMEKIVKEQIVETPSMEPISSLDYLDVLCVEEEMLRTKKIDYIETAKYDGSLKWMAEQLNTHREKRDAEQASR